MKALAFAFAMLLSGSVYAAGDGPLPSYVAPVPSFDHYSDAELHGVVRYTDTICHEPGELNVRNCTLSDAAWKAYEGRGYCFRRGYRESPTLVMDSWVKCKRRMVYCDGGAYLDVTKKGFYLSYEDPDVGTPPMKAGFYSNMQLLKVKIVDGKKTYSLGPWWIFEPCGKQEIQP